MWHSMLKVAAVDFGIQWVMWGVSSALHTEQFYDLTGSITFLLITYISHNIGGRGSLRKLVASGMVSAWALRLGSFLFLRVMKAGEDKRFEKVKHDPQRFFIYWTIQGVWVFVTLLPTLILNFKRKSDPPIGWRDYLGWAVWVFGFVFEVAADQQKTAFRANPDNAGRFVSTGLWSISRHPNYFGEIVSWFGIWLTASSAMSGVEYLSVLSPIFVGALITRLSGIPILERMAEKRWGNDPAYISYRDSTAVLVPFVW